MTWPNALRVQQPQLTLVLSLALALVLMLLVIVLPVASLLQMSLWSREGVYIGLDNFWAYAHNPSLRLSTVNSLVWSALSATLCVVLAYAFAYALTHACVPARKWFKHLALIPLLTPSLLMGISLVYLFGNQGLLKQVLWVDSAYGPFGIVVGSVLWTFPHAVLILNTALSTMDARLYEAASTMGASGWRVFRQVTLPASRYGLLISWLVVFVLVITDFGVPKVIGGNTAVLATDIYKQVIGQQNLPMGAVVAVLLLLPALLAFFAEQHLRSRQNASLGVRAVVYEPQPHAWRDGVLGFYCLMVCATLLLVLGVAIFASLATYWPYNLTPSLKNYKFDMMDGGGWASYGNSLKMAIATSVLGSVLSFFTAYLVSKPAGLPRLRSWLNGMASIPMAVPGLALGLGYILFFNAPWNPLQLFYGGLGLLVVCTVAHCFSVAHFTFLSALGQLDPEYEKVSESLGVPYWRLLWRVYLPVCVPTFFQVAGYFFVSAMTTVSAVVFIYSPETSLASIAVLAMDDAGDIAPAAAMACLIVLTAGVGRGLLGLLEWWATKRTQRWRRREG